MDRFSEVMDVVFRWEGGFVDNPYDNGGPTNMGITHAVLAHWRGVGGVSSEEVRSLTRTEAEAIFRSRYWQTIHGDQLPQPIDLICMDGAVNHGPTTSLKMLQGALAVSPTGEFDAATEAALKALADRPTVVALAIAVADARKERYASHEDYQHFRRGWQNRLNDVMQRALTGYGANWTFEAGGTISSGPSVVPTSSLPVAAIEDSDLQSWLSKSGFLGSFTPGVFDSASAAAVNALLAKFKSVIAGDWSAWPVSRKKMAAGQLLCDELGFDPGRIDGLFGPRTEQAFLSYSRAKLGLEESAWRDGLPAPGAHSKPDIAQSWPTEADVPNFFGPLGEDCKLVPTRRLNLPYRMRLAWDLGTEIDGFSVHDKVYDSASTAFEQIFNHYGADGVRQLGLDVYGGCSSCRKKRGGSSWSMHSWSIAIDFDPARNQLKWDHRTARLARDDAKPFWEIWEGVGWTSLGRAADYDWMHVQAARLA